MYDTSVVNMSNTPKDMESNAANFGLKRRSGSFLTAQKIVIKRTTIDKLKHEVDCTVFFSEHFV